MAVAARLPPPARDLLRQARVGGWWYFVPLPLASFPFQEGATRALLAVEGMLLASLCLFVAYFVNNLADRRIDGEEEKNPFIGSPEGRDGLVYPVLASVVGLAGAFLLGAIPGVAALVSLATGWTYSYVGRLKRFPIAGSVLNLGIFTPLGLFCTEGSQPGPSTLPLMVVFSLLLLQNQLLHEMVDADEDRGRVLTTYLWIGFLPTYAAVVTLGAAVPLYLGSSSHLPIQVPACTLYFAAMAFLTGLQTWRWREDRMKLRALRNVQRILGLAGGALLGLALAGPR